MITSLGSQKLPSPPQGGSVVSIGVFDGVHLGHQAILEANVARARELGAVPSVITFRRHPKKLLLGRAPRMLTSLEHRLELFRRAGIAHVLVLTFDEALRNLTPEAFLKRYALDALGARAFVLGFDSKFGRDRRGTPQLLAELGHPVEVVDKVVVGSRAVSSTAIREAVELGDLGSAERMLGRPVSVMGTVVPGDARGRQLGFPTANLNLHHELHPPLGVYAGWARVLPRRFEPGPDGKNPLISMDKADSGALGPRAEAPGEDLHGAVANIGVRPTIPGKEGSGPLLEVHLLDYQGDLYGSNLDFQFAGRLRGERRFDSLEALVDQIQRDVAAAREILGSERASSR